MPKYYESVTIGDIRHAPTPKIKEKVQKKELPPPAIEGVPDTNGVQPKQRPSRKVKGNG